MPDDPDVTPASEADDDFDRIIAGARAGDSRAIEWLFVQMQPRLLRYLAAQERRVADDLAGEVWLAVATRLQSFEGGWTEFRAWFFSIARRRLADHRRTAARRRTDATEASVFEIRPTEDSTEQRAVDSMSGREAAELIASTLREDQAEVLLLRILADLDVEQVASIMSQTPNWVRVTQHRALRTLAKRIGPKIAVMR